MLPAITSTAIDYNLEDRFWIRFKFSVPWWLSETFYKTDYFSGRNMNVLIISSGIFMNLSLFQFQFSSIATLSFKLWKVIPRASIQIHFSSDDNSCSQPWWLKIKLHQLWNLSDLGLFYGCNTVCISATVFFSYATYDNEGKASSFLPKVKIVIYASRRNIWI